MRFLLTCSETYATIAESLALAVVLIFYTVEGLLKILNDINIS